MELKNCALNSFNMYADRMERGWVMCVCGVVGEAGNELKLQFQQMQCDKSNLWLNVLGAKLPNSYIARCCVEWRYATRPLTHISKKAINMLVNCHATAAAAAVDDDDGGFIRLLKMLRIRLKNSKIISVSGKAVESEIES